MGVVGAGLEGEEVRDMATKNKRQATGMVRTNCPGCGELIQVESDLELETEMPCPKCDDLLVVDGVDPLVLVLADLDFNDEDEDEEDDTDLDDDEDDEDYEDDEDDEE